MAQDPLTLDCRGVRVNLGKIVQDTSVMALDMLALDFCGARMKLGELGVRVHLGMLEQDLSIHCTYSPPQP